MHNPLSYSIETIPRGDLGIISHTLPKMIRLIRAAKAHPLVRGFAVRLVSTCQPADTRCRIQRIYRWVSTRIRFVPDPRKVELLHEPLAILQVVRRQGWAAGDCDDYSLILSSLLESVGVKTRLVAVATAPAPNWPLRHVYVQALVGAGQWLRLDPLGMQYPEESFTRNVIREV